MFRIDDNTAAGTPPDLPTDNIGPPGYFKGGVPGSSTATRVRFWWLNMVQEELVAVVAAAGIGLVKSVNNQVLAALQALFVGQSNGLNQQLGHRLSLGLSTTSTAARITVDATDLGEVACFGQLAVGDWIESYTTLGPNGNQVVTRSFTAPRKGRVSVKAQVNFANQVQGSALLSVACNGVQGSSDNVANTTSLGQASNFEVAAGAVVTVSSYVGLSSTGSVATGHVLEYLFVPE